MTEPTYSGEVQFAGYTDSSRSGPRVTLRLADRSDLERFVGLEGKRFMLALVEIGDDEQPAKTVEMCLPEPEPSRGPIGPLCKWAVLRQADSRFIAWCGEDDPRAYILRKCNIPSRRDLDMLQAAAGVFHSQIRKPFEAWCKARGLA